MKNIAIRCTYSQFKELRDKIDYHVDQDFNKYPYLILTSNMCYKYVTNVDYETAMFFELEIIECFDADLFLKSIYDKTKKN